MFQQLMAGEFLSCGGSRAGCIFHSQATRLAAPGGSRGGGMRRTL